MRFTDVMRNALQNLGYAGSLSAASLEALVRAFINSCVVEKKDMSVVIADGLEAALRNFIGEADKVTALLAQSHEFDSGISIVNRRRVFETCPDVRGLETMIQEVVAQSLGALEVPAPDSDSVSPAMTSDSTADSTESREERGDTGSSSEAFSPLADGDAKFTESGQAPSVPVVVPVVAAPFLAVSADATGAPLSNALHQRLMAASDFYFALQVAKTGLDTTSEEGRDKKALYESLQVLVANICYQDQTTALEVIRGIGVILRTQSHLIPAELRAAADVIARLCDRYVELSNYLVKDRSFFQTLWQARVIDAKIEATRALLQDNYSLLFTLLAGRFEMVKDSSSHLTGLPPATLASARSGWWSCEFGDRERDMMNDRNVANKLSYDRTGKDPAALDAEFCAKLDDVAKMLPSSAVRGASAAASAAPMHA